MIYINLVTKTRQQSPWEVTFNKNIGVRGSFVVYNEPTHEILQLRDTTRLKTIEWITFISLTEPMLELSTHRIGTIEVYRLGQDCKCCLSRLPALFSNLYMCIFGGPLRTVLYYAGLSNVKVYLKSHSNIIPITGNW